MRIPGAIESLERRAYLAGVEFGASKNFDVGGTPQGVVVGDFNSDGKADVAFSNFDSGTIAVLFGDGKGELGSLASYIAGSNLSGAAAGDLNGDGKLDL